jgi:hypothetical protein
MSSSDSSRSQKMSSDALSRASSSSYVNGLKTRKNAPQIALGSLATFNEGEIDAETLCGLGGSGSAIAGGCLARERRTGI